MPKEERVTRRSAYTPIAARSNSSPNEPEAPRRMSIFGRISNALGFITRKVAPAKPVKTVLRPFPFRTASGVCFFSTSDSQLGQFGYRHTQRLQYTRGALVGTMTTVVGERLGYLWIVDDDEEFARPLPQLSKRDIDEAYGFTVEFEDSALAAAKVPSDLDAEQIEFLQNAPDLRLTVGDLETSSVNLAPVYAQVNDTITLGWAGERPVMLSGGGLELVECSASASVVIPVSSALPHVEGFSDSDEDAVATRETRAEEQQEAAASSVAEIPDSLGTETDARDSTARAEVATA